MGIKIKNKVIAAAAAVITVISMTMGNVINAATPEATLLNTYGNMFGKIGASAEYQELCDSSVQGYMKGKYNSTTLGNHMKPDFILSNWSPKMISVTEARRLGYYIPSNYQESTVPQLNFKEIDHTLKMCYEQGLALRGHTLLWHSQTPDWFFRGGYNKNAGYVSQAVMDARTEMYIKTVMNYVHKHQYGSVVYAWDVVNEFLHATETGWSAIYGKPNPRAPFIKRAFEYADEVLVDLGLTDSVSLFYNDFNTYMIPDDIVTLVNYVNSDKKVCDGVGMQSHLGTSFPSVDYYNAALTKFAKAGFEIQITELDVTNTSETEQAQYLYDLFSAIIKAKQAGANITSITFWGLHDGATWIPGKNPLIFKDLYTPKQSYYAILKAYEDHVGAPGAAPETKPEATPNPNYVTLKDGWYYIKNVGAQKYLQVTDNKGGNAVNVEIGTGTGVAGQKWYLTNTAEGYVTLKNGQGYALDVVCGEDKDSTNIQTYTANGLPAQQFKVLPTSTNNVYGIVTKCSTDVRGLDVANKATTDGANVQQYFYYGAANQTWVFESCSAPDASTTPEQPEQPDVPTVPSSDVMRVKLTSDWGDGAVADFTITNTTGTNLENWTCTFTTNREITSIWNATIVSQNGNTYTITGPTWQPGLATGASYTFGCQLGSGSDLVITDASLK